MAIWADRCTATTAERWQVRVGGGGIPAGRDGGESRRENKETKQQQINIQTDHALFRRYEAERLGALLMSRYPGLVSRFDIARTHAKFASVALNPAHSRPLSLIVAHQLPSTYGVSVRSTDTEHSGVDSGPLGGPESEGQDCLQTDQQLPLGRPYEVTTGLLASGNETSPGMFTG